LGKNVLISVAPEDADSLREMAALLFAGIEMCSGGKYDPMAILEEVKAGRSQLWALVSDDEDPKFISAAVTELFNHPGHRTCRIWMAGGDFEALVINGGPTFDEFARAEGCKNIEVDGPDFIVPFLARHGFKLTSCTMSKEM
jgi:hypothetical protein